MATQKFMGRNQITKRLAAQVGDKRLARNLMVKNGLATKSGKLTAKGKKRDAMTAEERAIDRAAGASKQPKNRYRYNPATNQATLKKRDK